MSRKNLPPLEVDTTYRVRDFANFEFSARVLHKAVTGEDTAILRLLLANETILEIPATEDHLHRLMLTLMEAYPSVAKEHVKMRGWL